MNEANIGKLAGYDKFKCTADKCRLTCCQGWEISVDNDTYEKLNNESKNYVLDKVKKHDDKDEYIIDKNIECVCPFLSENGLCEIVKNDGQEYISKTCQRFPRIENELEERVELSLSCACHEVVDLLEKEDEIKIVMKNNKEPENNSLELKIRKSIIDILNLRSGILDVKLIVAFEMLLNMLEDEDELYVLKKYSDKEELQEVFEMYEEVDFDTYESLEELNSLFLDIVENYKEVSGIKDLLEGLYDFAQDVEISDLTKKVRDFKFEFDTYDSLIRKCVISKVISSCVNDDVYEMAISLELIILEYLLMKYAVFLKYCMDGEINIQNIKDYIVVFSRVVGNNEEAVIEFLREGFEEPLLETGYICFIALI